MTQTTTKSLPATEKIMRLRNMADETGNAELSARCNRALDERPGARAVCLRLYEEL